MEIASEVLHATSTQATHHFVEVDEPTKESSVRFVLFQMPECILLRVILLKTRVVEWVHACGMIGCTVSVALFVRRCGVYVLNDGTG